MNTNFRIKSILSKNWGHVFTPKFGEKNARTQSFQDCIIKGSVRLELVTADLDTVSESAIFVDDVSRLRGIGEKRVRLHKKGNIRVQVIIKITKFSFIPRIVISHIRVGFMFWLWV
jgi:hypothetical protein